MLLFSSQQLLYWYFESIQTNLQPVTEPWSPHAFIFGHLAFSPFPIPSSDNQERAPGKEPFQPQCPTATRHIWHYELSCGKSFKPKITVSGNVCLQLIILSANHVCILIQILTLNMSLCIVIFPAALLSFTRIYLETFYLNQFLLRFYSVQWRAFLLILKNESECCTTACDTHQFPQ